MDMDMEKLIQVLRFSVAKGILIECFCSDVYNLFAHLNENQIVLRVGLIWIKMAYDHSKPVDIRIRHHSNPPDFSLDYERLQELMNCIEADEIELMLSRRQMKLYDRSLPIVNPMTGVQVITTIWNRRYQENIVYEMDFMERLQQIWT
uniref:Uncharacterized protein n=1 Tax=Acrobeloides nanus TaxID=290746 RepID=A0A914DCU2_9BILA